MTSLIFYESLQNEKHPQYINKNQEGTWKKQKQCKKQERHEEKNHNYPQE